jgi:LysM repeat protein
MGNFEKLSVLVIVVIIVMILVVALYTWTDGSTDTATKDAPTKSEVAAAPLPAAPPAAKPLAVFPIPSPTPSASGTGTGAIPPLPPLVKPSSPLDANVIGPAPLPPAIAPVAEKPAESVESKTYEVASGDNATKIVKRQMSGVALSKGLAALEKANPGVDLNVLRVGQKLVIPGKGAEGDVAIAPASKESKAAGAKETVKAEGLKPGAIYVTHRGDTLPAISKRAYGTTDRWHEIWLANYSTLEDPSMVPAGTRLRIPN